MLGRMVRKIMVKVPDEQVQGDIKRYRQQAIELGATDAKIISSSTILIDERVRAKCLYPKCPWYGTNAQCPPHAIELEQTRRIVNKFHYALFIRFQVTSEEMTDKKRISTSHIKMYEIVSKIEADAFYDGYQFALGFACGPCKGLFCRDKECSALTVGLGCRHSLRARGSMEGVGMDVYSMAASVGWDVYPIGRSVSHQEVPFGATYGLVLIY